MYNRLSVFFNRKDRFILQNLRLKAELICAIIARKEVSENSAPVRDCAIYMRCKGQAANKGEALTRRKSGN